MRGWGLLGVAALLVGCVTERTGTEDRDRYIAFCRETARLPVGVSADSDDAWMVYPCTATTQEFKKGYKVVYVDRDYLSFRCEDYSYTGGAHGTMTITVGTIDRKTGNILTCADVAAFANSAALRKKLADAVVAKIGKEALQGEIRLHDNFYLAKDGWHFVFNAYEVACHAVGAVEVVIPR